MTLPNSPKIEAAGKDAKRFTRDEKILAVIYRLANGRWALFDANDVRMATESFETPAQARRAYSAIEQARNA